MNSKALTLIGTKLCPFVERSMIVLAFKNLPYEFKTLNMFSKPQWFLEISPYGKVPCLVHDGFSVFESAVIDQYLDEAFPKSPKIMANDPRERALERILTHWCNTIFARDMFRLLFNKDFRMENNMVDIFNKDLDFLNEALSGRLQILHDSNSHFSMGSDRFGYADASLSPFLARLCLLQAYKKFIMKERPFLQNLINDLKEYDITMDLFENDKMIKKYEPFMKGDVEYTDEISLLDLFEKENMEQEENETPYRLKFEEFNEGFKEYDF